MLFGRIGDRIGRRGRSNSVIFISWLGQAENIRQIKEGEKNVEY
jgi:hypothetical protein